MTTFLWTAHYAQRTSIRMQQKEFFRRAYNIIMRSTINKIGVIKRFI